MGSGQHFELLTIFVRKWAYLSTSNPQFILRANKKNSPLNNFWTVSIFKYYATPLD